ncbi:MAG: hypothetical protein WC551_07505 [Patescibacteria group bacterium]
MNIPDGSTDSQPVGYVPYWQKSARIRALKKQLAMAKRVIACQAEVIHSLVNAPK